MPTSRKRKTESRKKNNPHPIYRVGEFLQLKPRVFKRLQKTEDFVSFLRMARVLNSLDYASYLLRNPPDIPSDALLERYRIRTIFIAAGYLFEGLMVVKNMKERHAKDEYFQPLLNFLEPTYEKQLKTLEAIRHNVFHLDKWDMVTTKTTMEINLKYYRLYSEPKDKEGRSLGLYFPIVDLIDLNYLINELQPHDNPQKAYSEILNSIPSFHKEFFNAARIFVTGLGLELGLMTIDDA